MRPVAKTPFGLTFWISFPEKGMEIKVAIPPGARTIPERKAL